MSVIIVTRDRPAMLRSCLEHLLQQDYDEDFETIVEDSSSDEQAQAVLDDFPQVVRLRIRHAGRTNINQARNLGIESATGTLIALLDDDCRARGNWLSRLVEACTASDTGITGGRCIHDYETSTIDAIRGPSA